LFHQYNMLKNWTTPHIAYNANKFHGFDGTIIKNLHFRAHFHESDDIPHYPGDFCLLALTLPACLPRCCRLPACLLCRRLACTQPPQLPRLHLASAATSPAPVAAAASLARTGRRLACTQPPLPHVEREMREWCQQGRARERPIFIFLV
jgi:hypothetical protein